MQEHREIFFQLVHSKTEPFSLDKIADEFYGIVGGDYLIHPSQTMHDVLERLRDRGYFRMEKGKYVPITMKELIEKSLVYS